MAGWKPTELEVQVLFDHESAGVETTAICNVEPRIKIRRIRPSVEKFDASETWRAIARDTVTAYRGKAPSCTCTERTFREFLVLTCPSCVHSVISGHRNAARSAWYIAGRQNNIESESCQRGAGGLKSLARKSLVM